ncbi:MAG: hypothetical protein OEY59_05130 [Deltaproteobacteria bacterium]|nr:hypothetical protein [Deltaproteobacteria bacterium]
MKITKLLVVVVSLFVIGCNGSNSHPSDQIQKLKIDISSAKKSIGYPSTQVQNQGKSASLDYIPTQSDFVDGVKSLIVGSLVVKSRSTPFDNNMAFTDQALTDMKLDLASSSNYFSVIDLTDPANQNDIIEVKIPPKSDENWQIVVAGLRTIPNAPLDLGNAEHDNAIAYYGFSDNFMTEADLNGSEVLSIHLQRACLLKSRPKGCAIYKKTGTYEANFFGSVQSFSAIVSYPLEILEVKVNDDSNPIIVNEIPYPIIVREDQEFKDLDNLPVGEKLNLTAMQDLSQIKDAIVSQLTLTAQDLLSITIVTTHSQNPAETAQCQALANQPDVSSDALRNACEVAEYKTIYSE